MLLTNPYVLLGGVLAVVLAVGGAYIKGRGDGAALERAELKEDAELVRETREVAMRSAAEAIAAIEIKQVTIRQTLEKAINEKPAYRDCVHSPDGLRAVNAALTWPGPAGGSKLPGARPNDQ